MISESEFSLILRLAGNGQEQFELWWELVLSIKSVWEVDSSNSAVCVDLHSQSLYVVGTVGPSGEIRQVELNLIPSLVEPHWHGTNKRLNPGRRLVVWGAESSSYTLVIQDLNLEGEVLLEVLDDHDQEGKLDGQGSLGVQGSVDVVGGHIGSHDFKHGGLNVGIRDSLDVAVSDLLVPDLEWLGSVSNYNEWLENCLKRRSI